MLIKQKHAAEIKLTSLGDFIKLFYVDENNQPIEKSKAKFIRFEIKKGCVKFPIEIDIAEFNKLKKI